MSINIPNKIYQVLVLIGLIMIGYAQYNIDKELQRKILPTLESFIMVTNKPLEAKSLMNISDIFQDRIDSNIRFYKRTLNHGLITLSLGLIMWFVVDGYTDKKITIRQKDKVYKYCQSCAKNFSSIRLYGTNRDLSQNYGFCEDCYEKGKFSNPSLTQEKVREKTKKSVKNKCWLIRNKLKLRIDNLERWKSDDYT